MYFECSMTTKFILADIEYHKNCQVNVPAVLVAIMPYLNIHTLTNKMFTT